MTDSENDKKKRKANRKKAIAVWNRRIAWVMLPSLLLSTFAVYAASSNWLPNLMNFGIATSLIFILLLFIHTIFSVYLFGFPELKWQIRVVHIYVGYSIFIFTMISQSIIGIEPYHNIFYALNWLFIIVHITLSIRFMLKRNWKRKPEPSLAFRGKGNQI